MDSEDIYQNVERRVIEDTTAPQTQNTGQDEEKDGKRRGSRCLVLMTVCLGIICVLLLIFIILQFIIITAERDLVKSYKNTVEDFNHTFNSLQDNYTDLMTEKDQLNKKKQELDEKCMSLSEELMRQVSKPSVLFVSNELKSWSESRQYCRDKGADLVIINTEEKQRHITSFIKESVWIGLSDIEIEGTMKWVNDSPLKQAFWTKGEPNNYTANEDCIELNPKKDSVNNWNDHPCTEKRKWICEK